MNAPPRGVVPQASHPAFAVDVAYFVGMGRYAREPFLGGPTPRDREALVSLANILRALEGKGWVEREHSKTDRRRVHVTVTDKGRQDLEIKRREFEDRTAACKKETSHLKGEEHSTAFARCLKADKVARTDSPAQDRQQNKMKACNAEAGRKELKGDERRAFMSNCLKG